MVAGDSLTMPDTHRSDTEVVKEFFAELSKLRAGMLGVMDREARMRPMTHFVDEDTKTLWFLTSRSTELAAEIGDGGIAHYCLMDDASGYYAWISGTLRPSENSGKIDDIWGPTTAAWFTGRDDPDLLLLEMPLREAEVWTSTDSSVQFGIEIARANIDPEKKPDVGSHQTIRF